MPDNAADRKSIRRLEKQSAIDLAQRTAFVRQMMSTVEGRSWVWYQLSLCHVFATTFTGDALTSAFREGERNVGQLLLNDITSTCPDQFIQAMREAHERDTLSQRRSSPIDNGRDSGRAAGADEGSGYVNDYDPFDDGNDYEQQADRAAERNDH